jgi:hypothetical protein
VSSNNWFNWFSYQMMFVSFNCNTKGVTMGTGTANSSGIPEFTPDFNGVRVDQPLIFCAIFCSFLSIYLWPLHRLSSFDLRLLITLWYYCEIGHSTVQVYILPNPKCFRVIWWLWCRRLRSMEIMRWIMRNFPDAETGHILIWYWPPSW